jgi:hypothetical protein
LKFAIDFFARVTTARCPVIVPAQRRQHPDSHLLSLADPMLTTIFDGTAMMFVILKCFIKAGTISFGNELRRLALTASSASLAFRQELPAAAAASFFSACFILSAHLWPHHASHSSALPHFAGSRVSASPRIWRLTRVYFRSSCTPMRRSNLNRRFLLHDAALDIFLWVGTSMALDNLNALDDDLPSPG